MVKKQRNGTWVLFVIFGLAAVVALFMFSKPQLTGNVVVGEVTCDGTWTCGEWTTCAAETQTRTCESSDTTNCVGSSPVTESQSCVVAPTCSDTIQNQDETGIDCGGVCTACVVAPTCSDGIQNQDETGIDCGGVCTACVVAPTCSDGIQNQDETGIDCGGVCTACVVACAEDWTCEAWTCSDAGAKTRVCTDVNDCGTTNERPFISGDCNPETFGTTTTTTTETTTETTQENNIPTVCSPNIQQCANGNLYLCNSAGTGWDPSQTCALGCSGSACIVETAPVIPAETCEDGIKNQDEVGVDCGGVCSKRCSIFTLAGSVVNGPVESGKQFFTNLFSNKTRMYLILGGVVVLAAGLVSYLVFFKKKFKK
jgi:hypothetical protein